MDKEYFLELLHRYRLGNATAEECRFLLSYYKLFDRESDVLLLLNKQQQEELKQQIKTNIGDDINLREEQKSIKSVRKMWLSRFSVAAVLLILLSTGLYYFKYPDKKTTSLISRADDTKPHRLIRLADGSTIIISAGSKLNYPSSFDGLSKREVYLEGEAYFDIKHNPKKPFKIHTGKINTTVLGTAFNIKAWPLDADITVTVTRGRVKVDDHEKVLGIISPNQQIIYNKAESGAMRKVVDASLYLTWKDHDLLIDDITVLEASELLQDRFKVKVSITDDQIRTKRFTTTFLKGENLEQVLKSICEFNGAVYHYDKEKASVIISSNKTL